MVAKSMRMRCHCIQSEWLVNARNAHLYACVWMDCVLHRSNIRLSQRVGGYRKILSASIRFFSSLFRCSGSLASRSMSKAKKHHRDSEATECAQKRKKEKWSNQQIARPIIITVCVSPVCLMFSIDYWIRIDGAIADSVLIAHRPLPVEHNQHQHQYQANGNAKTIKYNEK